MVYYNDGIVDNKSKNYNNDTPATKNQIAFIYVIILVGELGGNMSKYLVFFTLLAIPFSSVFALEINLNNFVQEGPAANGTWAVSADGSNVFQSINGNPTFFVGPDVFINKEVTGKLRVEAGGGDDDFIGFVFGFGNSDADSFFLFSWKQGLQSGAPAGFVLSDVSGGSTSIPFGNNQLDAANYDALATNLDHGGWQNNVEYTFSLTYLDDEIKIDMLGGQFASQTTIFNFSGNFAARAGRFGFYNFSQQGVRYSDFDEIQTFDTGGEDPPPGEEDPPPPELEFETGVPEPNSFLLFGISGLLAFFAMKKKK